MAYEVPPLPYDYSALEPYIDTQTMQLHHDKHHQTYVTNVNNALQGHDQLAAMSVDDLLRNIKQVPESIRTAVQNNAGGHSNHSMFWNIMTPNGGGEPTGNLASAIQQVFGSFDAFKTAFNDAGTKRFGSGWAWLVHDGSGLQVVATPNQDSPISQGRMPLLGVDVWEHSYYLSYQNRRPDYIDAWWNTVNWSKVAEEFSKVG